MLMRSASMLILNSWIPPAKDPWPEPESFNPNPLPKTRSTSQIASCSPSSSDKLLLQIKRTHSETDLRRPPTPCHISSRAIDALILKEDNVKAESLLSVGCGDFDSGPFGLPMGGTVGGDGSGERISWPTTPGS